MKHRWRVHDVSSVSAVPVIFVGLFKLPLLSSMLCGNCCAVVASDRMQSGRMSFTCLASSMESNINLPKWPPNLGWPIMFIQIARSCSAECSNQISSWL
jgi:hypothetical protein